jgi:hypothetical protein
MSLGIERDIGMPLHSPFLIPDGLTVPNDIEAQASFWHSG